MKNFKLTAKEETLSYLENQKISLKNERKRGICSAVISGTIMSLGILGLIAPSSMILNIAAAGYMCSGGLKVWLSYVYVKNCDYELQKTEKKIGRIKEDSFTNKMMTDLEEEVVKAREEKTPLTKTMMTKGSK